MYLVPYTNINSKKIIDLNVIFKTTKLLANTRKIYVTLRQIFFYIQHQTEIRKGM